MPSPLNTEFPNILSVIGRDVARYAEAIAAAAAAQSQTGTLVWLSPDRAFDLPFRGPSDGVREAARAATGAGTLDINIVAAAERRKKLIVADMDSTIITCECLDEIADAMGLKPQVAAITERAMAGEIAFEPALRERVALLKGLPVHRLARVYGERVRLTPGARALLATMKAHGARSVLVSGGFTFFTKRVAADVGFDAHFGNALLDDGVYLTGKVADPILGREAKLQTLENEMKALGITAAETLAVGDGANDLAMIARAGLGVAFHAKPIVAAAAGARVDHGDLTALLYLQGYSDAEFVRV
ncbi:MAG TPA: phosphoserine phosphatase SerB [Rhizomicrobium sp.]|nr:phosphoserine phosphatase SerB [Rhizomicrobium sp.]